MPYGNRVDWSTRRTQVEELVLRHERERVTYKQLAAESSLPLPTLYAWIQRLLREKAEPGVSSTTPGSQLSFVELKTTSGGHDSALGGGVELVLTSGLRVRVDTGFHEATLKRLLALLGA